ncbi:hypothetical protein RHMOL_Rhmol12G0057000 [Rhododendron molle]|uniref:Uncharacterized protein n=1 Tax=Rhododendron molle TaxID=49168 RepID=A0ACC0LFM9_RHOML|nr:hypothetical protein RHMOL_Rhmol12G0057000 [Rhododendron molle]
MKVEISTQGTGWRRIGSTFPNCIVEPMASQAFVNGSVNWIVKNFRATRASMGCRDSIVSFDMSAETFSVLRLPPTLVNQESCSLSLKVFQGSLAVLCDRERDNGACCMWVMKEYGVPESWTKLFRFKLDLPVILKGELGFWKHGEVLSTEDNRLLSYDIGTKALTDTVIRDNRNLKRCIGQVVEPFVVLRFQLPREEGMVSKECARTQRRV